jgi:peroxiredoxin
MSLFDKPDRRSVLIGGAAAAAALTGGIVPVYAAPQINAAAPGFTLTGSDGKKYSLSDLKGKIVVLEWTNHDCPYVKKHYNGENMQKLQREVTGTGAVWLTLISSAPGEQGHVSAAQANDLTKSRNAAPSAVLFDTDGKVGRAYGAVVTPHMYVIDAGGKLLYMGGIDSLATTRVQDIEQAVPYFRDAFVAVSKGQPVKDAVTRAYGCTIKYPLGA